MKTLPLISIVIPTLNSEKTLEKTLTSIAKQTYPRRKIEILIVDGNSSDNTLKIAKKFKCKIINNKKVLQVYAKHMGFVKAKGKYVMYLDSDEVLVSDQSIEKKIRVFQKDTRVKAVVPTGIITPKGMPPINDIINEFGDPFSYFIYGASVNPKFFLDYIKKTGDIIANTNDFLVVDFSKTKVLPPIELSAIGITVEKKFLLSNLKEITKNPYLISQSFFELVKKGSLVGFTKKDTVLHYSVASTRGYLRKLNSRVKNNIYKNEMGMSAFSGRDEYYARNIKIRKYLFIPYSLSLVFPWIDGVNLAVTRKSMIFLAFPLICLYISYLIIYYTMLKTIGITPKLKGYGV